MKTHAPTLWKQPKLATLSHKGFMRQQDSGRKALAALWELCATFVWIADAPRSSMRSSCRAVDVSSVLQGVPLASSVAVCTAYSSTSHK